MARRLNEHAVLQRFRLPEINVFVEEEKKAHNTSIRSFVVLIRHSIEWRSYLKRWLLINWRMMSMHMPTRRFHCLPFHLRIAGKAFGFPFGLMLFSYVNQIKIPMEELSSFIHSFILIALFRLQWHVRALSRLRWTKSLFLNHLFINDILGAQERKIDNCLTQSLPTWQIFSSDLLFGMTAAAEESRRRRRCCWSFRVSHWERKDEL